jgi:predicted RNA-binding protein (virulence factor B family)
VKGKTYKVRVRGISPLLLHRNSFEMEKLLAKARNNEAKQKVEEENYHLYLYLDGDGRPYVPDIMLQRAFIEAAKEFQQQGKRKKTYKNIVAGGFVNINEPEIPIISQSGYKPDKRFVKVQKNRVLRVRPRFDDWELEFTITIDESIDHEVVKKIIEHAGAYIGIGDFRPTCSGPFGRFEILEFQPLN